MRILVTFGDNRAAGLDDHLHAKSETFTLSKLYGLSGLNTNTFSETGEDGAITDETLAAWN